jgi:large subunit ribosomal protein L9
MKVVLLDNIKGIGQVGDIKDVSDGYARNFLFPRNAARSASEGVLKDVQTLKLKKLQELALAKDKAQELATKLAGIQLELTGKANDKGTLFAGIEAHHVADAVTSAAGVKISPDMVKLPEHIKTVGEHQVVLELADGVTASVTVVVTAEK